jgi:DNA adenine methylase
MVSDPLALERQTRRIERLKAQSIGRTTVFIHEKCRSGFDALRPLLLNPNQSELLKQIAEQVLKITSPINVSQVAQLSPFRYPGGKTWLVPEIRRWMQSRPKAPKVFVEPFAGGAMCGLTVASEQLAQKVVLTELDDDVAAVWKTIFEGKEVDIKWLCNRIESFDVAEDAVRAIIEKSPRSLREKAFRTIIKNRMQRGGIIAPGAGLIKAGEGGKGLMSRWYPSTLVRRIESLRAIRDRVEFTQGDAFTSIKTYAKERDAAFFVDPPYTAGGKKAGARLYAHHVIDHALLFATLAKVRGSVLMTYDDAPEVHDLATKNGFSVARIAMKSSHHALHKELLITKE